MAGIQTCQLPDNSSQAYSFWAMAIRGSHEYAVMAGSTIVDGSASEFSLATGLLTRSKA